MPQTAAIPALCVSSDVESICTPAALPKSSSTSTCKIFPIKAIEVETGVLQCGPVLVPESWRFLCTIHSSSRSNDARCPAIQGSTVVKVESSDEFAGLCELDLSLPMFGGSIVGSTESQKTSANLLQQLTVEIIETVLAFEAEDNH